MSAVSTVIEPHRVTRIFFDSRDVAPDPADQRRIEHSVERSFVLAETDDEINETLLPLTA